MPTRVCLLASGIGVAVLTGALWTHAVANARESGATTLATAIPRPVPKPALPNRPTLASAHVAAIAKRKRDSANDFERPASGPRIGIVPEDLLAKRLIIPVPNIAAEALQPHFYDARGERGHEAIDILAQRGEPVVATEDGNIVKLFLSRPGGNTIYEFDPTQKYAYYYAHLDRYADGLKEGDTVKRGQIIGYVGSTGNADPSTPHLHFAIFRLGPEKQWWKGEALDPYPALIQ